MSRAPAYEEIEEQVFRLCSISFGNKGKLVSEVEHWQWAIETGLVTQEEAEAQATQRAGKILHRLTARLEGDRVERAQRARACTYGLPG